MSMKRPSGRNKAAMLVQRAGRAMKPLQQDQSGVTALEYSLLAALIAVVILGSVSTVGSAVTALWAQIAAKVMAAI